MRYSLTILSLIYLSSCSYIGSQSAGNLTPLQAIKLTSESESNTASGSFEFKVKSVDQYQRMMFLNSESDSKDQRNITVAIRPNAISQLAEINDGEAGEWFMNKKIRVIGEAQRQKIWVLHRNLNTGQYYYQTKIYVKSAEQISTY